MGEESRPNQSPPGPTGRTGRPIEIGWVLAGRLDVVDAKAAERGRHLVLDALGELAPGLAWSMPVVHRAELVAHAEVEPTMLLDHALVERNQQRWDSRSW